MRTLWTDKFASLRQQTKHRADIKPQVGMGVTQHVGSDSNPWEIIEVIDDKHIVVRELDYDRTDNNGMSDCQDYQYYSSDANRTKRLTFRGDRWCSYVQEERAKMDANGEPIRDQNGTVYELVVTRKLSRDFWKVGVAIRYYDFSF